MRPAVRYLLFIMTLTLTACGGQEGNTPAPSETVQTPEVKGEEQASKPAAACDVMTADYTFRPMALLSGDRIEEGPFYTSDGERIVYVNNLQGWEYEIATGVERCLTCDFPEPAEIHRIYPMVDGSYMIAGPSQESEEALQGVHEALARIMGDELWWLDGDLQRAPQALGSRVFEGFAVSTADMKIAWSNSPVQLAFTNSATEAPNTAFSVYVADVVVVDGQARLDNIEYVHEEQTSFIEVQDFVPGDQALTLSTYWSLERRLTPSDPVGALQTFFESGGYINLIDIDAEAWTLDLNTGEFINQSNSPDTYDEFEGIHPGGKISSMETSQGGDGIGLSLVEIDGTGKNIRLFDRADVGYFLDTSFHPDGRTMVGAYGLNNDTDRVIVTRPAIAFMEFDCP